MRRADRIRFSVFADWFINFSVFWFGVAIVGPVFPGIDANFKVVVLIIDVLLGILSLFVAYRLRKEIS